MEIEKKILVRVNTLERRLRGTQFLIIILSAAILVQGIIAIKASNALQLVTQNLDLLSQVVDSILNS